MRLNACLWLAVVCSSLACGSCQHPRNDADAHCLGFAQSSLEGLLINNTEAVSHREDLPGFCSIKGSIEPGIGFEARFPLADWNGKYFQAGCGGYCGSVLPDKPGFSNTINEALKRGYATITTDAGHSGGLGDASWAKGHPLAVKMYADEAIPRTYRAGTRMVEAFYGTAARLEYFGGCSNGGRMAAMAAQRYPDLFDGILGGSGVINLSQNGGIYGSWVVQSNTTAEGQRILTRENFAARLPLLEALIIEQCDATDGQTDGVISMPRRCAVDVTALPRCEHAPAEACFTDSELQVLQKWYQGPHDSSGQSIYPGMPAGSERFWAVWYLDSGGKVAPGNALGGDYAKYLGFEGGAPDDYSAMDFDFDRDPPRLQANGQLLDALDPDLADFQQAGGKFLMWHGWQDPLVLPDQSVAYYEAVLKEMGGPAEVESFFRLFMIPGQGHCWEMPSSAPDRFNPIVVLENWVENGEAPTQLDVYAADPDSTAIDATAVCSYPSPPVYFTQANHLSDNSCSQ